MQGGISHERNVRPSVKRVHCDKTEGSSAQILPRCMQCRRGLAMRILSVRQSVRLSVTRVDCDKTVEKSVQIYIPYERTFILVF